MSDIENDQTYSSASENDIDYPEEEYYFKEKSPSPEPENEIPECVYCDKSILQTPHKCGATVNCLDNKNIMRLDCQCMWHKQIKNL